MRFPGATHLVILVNDNYRWLTAAAYKRLIQELTKLKVKLNSGKTKIVDLTKGDTFSFLGFVYRRVKTHRGKWAVVIIPKMKARTSLLRKLKEVFHKYGYSGNHWTPILEISGHPIWFLADNGSGN